MVLSQQFLQQALSLYIHLPWCLHKCPYCDFNSHATEKNAFPEQQYVACLIDDLEQASQSLQNRTVQSIFIGGGTPSLFSPYSIKQILLACKRFTNVNVDCEITLETNPGTFEVEKFTEFKSCGVNRLSIGVQSFNDAYLHKLQRIHNAKEALQAISTAYEIGFENINIDLMFGLPQQTVPDAVADLRFACNQPVSHISYYQLTLEPNTIFHRYPPQLPSNDTCWEMQTNGIEQLELAGYLRYEVSAYAIPGQQCRHNHNYWAFGDYLGIGAGAHSKISTLAGVHRNQRIRQPASYVQAVSQQQHVMQQRQLKQGELVFEFMLNHLRLVGGFTKTAFTQATGLSFDVIEQTINHAAADGLLDSRQDRVRATELGYRFLDDVVQRFMAENPC